MTVQSPADPRVLTRQTPRRRDELLDGGSLYRVFKGQILCRQRILSIDTVGEGPARRCVIGLDADIVRTRPAPRRPFQGWRYLTAADAPHDDLLSGETDQVPADLVLQLKMLGAW